MKKRTRRILLLCGLFFALVPICCVSSYDPMTRSREAAAVEKLRDLGFDGSVATYQKRKPRPEENAAALYDRLEKAWDIRGTRPFLTLGDKPGEPQPDPVKDAALIEGLAILRTRKRLWVEFEPQLWNRRSDYMTLTNIWFRALRDGADRDSREGRHQKAQDKMRTAYYLVALCADEGSRIGYEVASMNRRDADYAVSRIMNNASDPAVRLAWRKVLPAEATLPDFKKIVENAMLETLHFNPFDPYWGPHRDSADTDLLKKDFVKRRIRANMLEYLQGLAERTSDGRLTTEGEESLTSSAREKSRFEPLVKERLFSYSHFLHRQYPADDKEIQQEQILAAADALVEHAGGPRAPKRPLITAERSFGMLRVEHNSSQEVVVVSVDSAWRHKELNRKLP